MEELELTDPIVVPEKVTAKYRVVSLFMNMIAIIPEGPPGLVSITVRNEHDEQSNYNYYGDTATDMIKFLNTANLTTKSMHKRILERLSNDGLLPGTVVGTPDAPTSDPGLRIEEDKD